MEGIDDKSKIVGKHPLELNVVGDGRVFLNFWNYMHGNDIIAEIKEGKLFIDETADRSVQMEITFNEYLALVYESIRKRNNPHGKESDKKDS